MGPVHRNRVVRHCPTSGGSPPWTPGRLYFVTGVTSRTSRADCRGPYLSLHLPYTSLTEKDGEFGIRVVGGSLRPVSLRGHTPVQYNLGLTFVLSVQPTPPTRTVHEGRKESPALGTQRRSLPRHRPGTRVVYPSCRGRKKDKFVSVPTSVCQDRTHTLNMY